MASSTELSTTSQTRWCSPDTPVLPMYIPGRLRTCASPSRMVIELAEYDDWISCANARAFQRTERCGEAGASAGGTTRATACITMKRFYQPMRAFLATPAPLGQGKHRVRPCGG